MKSTTNRFHARRETALRRIAEIRPFIEGSLCAVRRARCATPGWQLTFKQKGKTRTVYVPMELVAEVKAWTREYRKLKTLVRDVTRQSLAIVRGHVANRRAEKRGRASTRKPARGN